MSIQQTRNLVYHAVADRLRRMRQQYAGNPARITALNKAALNIAACNWAMSDFGLQIQSATDGERYYRVTPDGCSCSAGLARRPCWHQEAYRLLRAMGHGDDWQDDDSGYFVEDGLRARVETVLPRVSPAEAAMERLDSRALDVDSAAFRARRRYSEEEINHDLFD